jgi:hypothetical protein
MSNIFPTLDKFLLGDNPFTGVDHLSQERARERLARLDTKKIVQVIDTAFANGAQGLAFSTTPIIYEALREMKRRGDKIDFGLYPLLPYAQTYVRTATEKGLLGLAQEVLSKLNWKAKAKTIAGGGLSLATFDPKRVLRTYIDAELELLSNNAPENARVKSIFLHEIITDLAISFDAVDLIQGYANHIMDSYRVMPGFETRNFPKFVDFARRCELKLDQISILTPFNKVGFQMNPSREACEEVLNRSVGVNIIAMSILASGYIDLSSALQYLKGLGDIKSFVVGASTSAHAQETFSRMHTIFA